MAGGSIVATVQKAVSISFMLVADTIIMRRVGTMYLDLETGRKGQLVGFL